MPNEMKYCCCRYCYRYCHFCFLFFWFMFKGNYFHLYISWEFNGGEWWMRPKKTHISNQPCWEWEDDGSIESLNQSICIQIQSKDKWNPNSRFFKLSWFDSRPSEYNSKRTRPLKWHSHSYSYPPQFFAALITSKNKTNVFLPQLLLMSSSSTDTKSELLAILCSTSCAMCTLADIYLMEL